MGSTAIRLGIGGTGRMALVRGGRRVTGFEGGVSRPLVWRGGDRARMCSAGIGVVNLSSPLSGTGGKRMSNSRLRFGRHLLGRGGLPVPVLPLVRYFLFLSLPHRHALAVWSLWIFRPLDPMAALRGRGLLGAMIVLVGHLGGGPRPRGRLYARHGEPTRDRCGQQTSTAATTGGYKLVILQELGLVLGNQ